MIDTIDSALAYYARIGAALFPIPAGAKNPTGIVGSFALDCSLDSNQWQTWRAANPGCNFGVVAGASGIIIIDVDTEGDRDSGWRAWCDLCASWGIEPPSPHTQSARGGWHFYFQVPAGIDPRSLRQPDAIKGRINTRAANGYTVAAGSYYDGTAKGETSGPYILLTDAAPYPAPAALVELCTRRTTAKTAAHGVIGSHDPGQVAGLIRWLAERGTFADYESWLGCGMACKLEFGDAGLEIWQLAHDDSVTPEVEATKWQSFASEPTLGAQTLLSLLDRAHKAGWRGKIGKSTAAMFDGVQAIATAAGAKLLAPGTPGPSGGGGAGIPMLAGQEALAEVGAPILADFLSGTSDFPTRPVMADYPQIPESCSGHGLYGALVETIDRILAIGEMGGRNWKPARMIHVGAVLQLVHIDTYESVVRKLNSLGVTVPESQIKVAAATISDRVQRKFERQDEWIYDQKGRPEADNSDNVVVFLRIIGCQVRFNAWLNRDEILASPSSDFAHDWPTWTHVSDLVIAKLRTRATRKGTRFQISKDFLWESIGALTHANLFDPAVEHLGTLEAEWDGMPRLVIWLSAACGVPCDPYHQAVGRNIIGGIVRRVRHPGCKHDTMPVFFGPQGTGKSTLAAVLADMGQSSLAAILLSSGQWFTDNIMLGDAAKELVLSLAGKTVAEIGEMGTRGAANANHIKKMLSTQVDEGRTAYARAVASRPRRNIFIGTTNDDEPLSDPTGSRRFLPVAVPREINLQWLTGNVRQLVGEAAALESRGVDFSLPREVWALAAEHQEAARSESDLEIMLEGWFGATEISATLTTYVLGSDLVNLLHIMQWKNNTSQRGAIMRKLGFRRDRLRLGGKREHVWIRGAGVIGGAARYMVAKSPTDSMPVVRLRMEEAPGPGAVAPLPRV